MKNQFVFFILLFLLSCSGNKKDQPISHIEVKDIVSSTDILRTSFPDTTTITLYQGNGKFGCSYGPLGLHINPSQGDDPYEYGSTHYLHLEHRVRAKFGSDYLIPSARIYWKDEPQQKYNYKQHQSLYDGTITTHFEEGNNKTTVTTWFDPVQKDLTAISIDLQGNASDIIIAPFDTIIGWYGQDLVQASAISDSAGLWKVELTCLSTKTVMYIKTNAKVELQDNDLCLKLHSGENEILISINKPVKTTSAKSLGQTISWWNSKWENSGILVLPDPNAQKMWIRSMAEFLASFNADKLGLAPPCGFSGNGWPFPFPFSVSMVHPILLATGNQDIAKSWIEYWAERLPGIKAYTNRLLKVDGILCPWVFAYGDFEGYHDPIPPNKYYYEIHNSGYLARMAFETAVFINDDNWTRKFALPIVDETAKFYKSICTKKEDGLWHIYVNPSMGIDERGGANQEDYLCALFSAKYCFQKAIEYNLDSDGSYKTILNEGLAFPLLISKEGFYYSCVGSGEKDFGGQKHPVQLNDLAFLPLNSEVADPAAVAYSHRYDLTENAKDPFFYGWTLGDLLLAGSRIGNVEEWKRDWDNLLTSDYIDRDWIQVYETSRSHGMTHYLDTEGLIAQSLLNNLVSDWFGKLEIAKCNPWKGKVLIQNIFSILGVKINGEINNNSALIYLTAWKDCEFELMGEKITLKKDEKTMLNLNLTNSQIISKETI